MKRFFTLILSMALALALLTGCADDTPKEDVNPADQQTEQPVQPGSFDMTKVEGKWVTKSIDGKSVQDFCEEWELKTEDFDMVLDIHGTDVDTTLGGGTKLYPAEVGDTGFILRDEDTQMNVTYNEEDHTLTCDLPVEDGTVTFDMVRSH